MDLTLPTHQRMQCFPYDKTPDLYPSMHSKRICMPWWLHEPLSHAMHPASIPQEPFTCLWRPSRFLAVGRPASAALITANASSLHLRYLPNSIESMIRSLVSFHWVLDPLPGKLTWTLLPLARVSLALAVQSNDCRLIATLRGLAEIPKYPYPLDPAPHRPVRMFAVDAHG